jgi:phosphoserine phosphatase RsbU/P
VILGAIIFLAFVIAYGIRTALQPIVVDTAAVAAQPKRQFVFDFAVIIVAGIGAHLYNQINYAFPLGSGITLLFGFTVFGFFIALDMALAREYIGIQSAVSAGKTLPPPKRLYPMTRKFSIISIVASLFVFGIITMVISKDVVWFFEVGKNTESLERVQLSIALEMIFILSVLIALVINLIFSFSRNLKLLFQNETSVLERVSTGDLSQSVPVATNDEFGVIAGHTNTMIEGLRHRFKMMAALQVAEEVQQNLLPQESPSHAGLDIAGKSVYCDETGGDYFDYIQLSNGKLGIVVADAADHGVGAALYMTSARAFLLSNARHFPEPADLLMEVNRFLTRDSRDTGRFMSMFLAELDPSRKILRWVRAGHEPALFFDPSTRQFRELAGEGMVLGVDGDYRFKENTLDGWEPESILFIGTDGAKDAQNEKGAMFGNERVKEIIQENSEKTAEQICQALIRELTAFMGSASQADDITFVIIKMQ